MKISQDHSDTITALVLAAGKGTRMKSGKAKVLHEVFFKPMLHHVLDTLLQTEITNCGVIIGHQREEVAASLKSYPVTTITQEEQLGTGHAVLFAEEICRQSELVMILCGDTPLIRPETLNAMIARHRTSGATLTLLTTLLADPFGYGRIISDPHGRVLEIVEQKDADEAQRRIKEINAGIYLVDQSLLFSALKQIGTDNSQGEMYLTDIVAIANKEGHTVSKFTHHAAVDVLGVNSRIELALAHQELQKRRNHELMLSGVTIYAPETVFIGPEVNIGQDTIVHPCVQITGRSVIGDNCVLEYGSQLHNCHLAAQTRIGAQSNLQDLQLTETESIAPMTCIQE